MSLRSATVHSVNTVYAQLIDRLGPRTVVEVAEQPQTTTSLPIGYDKRMMVTAGRTSKELGGRIAGKLGFERLYPVTGQTYTRKSDYAYLAALAGVALSASKFANDMRLLQRAPVSAPSFGKRLKAFLGLEAAEVE
jgi:hypothetical protein